MREIVVVCVRKVHVSPVRGPVFNSVSYKVLWTVCFIEETGVILFGSSVFVFILTFEMFNTFILSFENSLVT